VAPTLDFLLVEYIIGDTVDPGTQSNVLISGNRRSSDSSRYHIVTLSTPFGRCRMPQPQNMLG